MGLGDTARKTTILWVTNFEIQRYTHMDAAFLDYPSVWLVLVPGFGFGRFEGTPPTGPIFIGLVLGHKPLRTLPATKEPLVTDIWLGEMPGFHLVLVENL